MQSDDELIEVEPLASDVYESMKGVNCKQRLRDELAEQIKAFKGRIQVLPPSDKKADTLIF